MKEYFQNILNGTIKNKYGNDIRVDQIGLYLKYYNTEVYDIIKKSGKSFSNYIYDMINDITVRPGCYCGNLLKFSSLTTGYNTYCCKKCQLNVIHQKFF